MLRCTFCFHGYYCLWEDLSEEDGQGSDDTEFAGSRKAGQMREDEITILRSKGIEIKLKTNIVNS